MKLPRAIRGRRVAVRAGTFSLLGAFGLLVVSATGEERMHPDVLQKLKDRVAAKQGIFQPADWRFTAKMHEKRIRIGSPVILLTKMTNLATQRLPFGEDGSDADFSFEIFKGRKQISASGRTSEELVLRRVGVFVEPGMAAERSVDLRDYAKVEEPGYYQVRVRRVVGPGIFSNVASVEFTLLEHW
jgi:hypothetical protein